MQNLFTRISATRTKRDKATKAQMDEVRELLPHPEEGRLAIPECMSADDGDYDYGAVAVMAYVMLKENNADYTLEQAQEDTGLHTVRLLIPELSYFYGQTGDKKRVIEHWDRVFEIIDSFDTCPNCKGKRVPAWKYCPWCAGIVAEEPGELPGNPTPLESSSET